MAQQEAIKIFKGNDTDFNDDKFITIKLTSNIDLSDFVGKFVLGSFSQTGVLADGKMEIVIPRSYTSQFPLGNMCGTFALIDNKGRYATITNTILFSITNEVFTPTEEEIQLETPEDYPVEIVVEVGFAGGNYEDLNNLPKINGVVVKGDKTGADYGLANASDITTLESKIDTHIANKNNPHEVSKAQIGLGNVDNTADLDKPISTATQTALNGKQNNLTQIQLDAVNSGIDSTKTAQITSNANSITSIESKIPSQASDQNQLADKNFVNSSIATNTANFIGTFNSVAELEAYSGTLTNNDYAFVIGTDSDGNTIYNRYKYTTATTPASWLFEYALNNSSFTAAQWAAINSGATSTNIAQIATNANNITSLQTTKLDATTAASTYATKTELTNGLAAKQDTINDLNTIRSGAAAGATALQVSDVDNALSPTSENPVQNKVIYATIGDVETLLNNLNSGDYNE